MAEDTNSGLEIEERAKFAILFCMDISSTATERAIEKQNQYLAGFHEYCLPFKGGEISLEVAVVTYASDATLLSGFVRWQQKPTCYRKDQAVQVLQQV